MIKERTSLDYGDTVFDAMQRLSQSAEDVNNSLITYESKLKDARIMIARLRQALQRKVGYRKGIHGKIWNNCRNLIEEANKFESEIMDMEW